MCRECGDPEHDEYDEYFGVQDSPPQPITPPTTPALPIEQDWKPKFSGYRDSNDSKIDKELSEAGLDACRFLDHLSRYVAERKHTPLHHVQLMSLAYYDRLIELIST